MLSGARVYNDAKTQNNAEITISAIAVIGAVTATGARTVTSTAVVVLSPRKPHKMGVGASPLLLACPGPGIVSRR